MAPTNEHYCTMLRYYQILLNMIVYIYSSVLTVVSGTIELIPKVMVIIIASVSIVEYSIKAVSFQREVKDDES